MEASEEPASCVLLMHVGAAGGRVEIEVGDRDSLQRMRQKIRDATGGPPRGGAGRIFSVRDVTLLVSLHGGSTWRAAVQPVERTRDSSLARLPRPIFVAIVQCLGPRDLVSLCSCQKRLRQRLSDRRLWAVCLRDGGPMRIAFEASCRVRAGSRWIVAFWRHLRARARALSAWRVAHGIMPSGRAMRLRGPCARSDLERLEARLGQQLPSSLRASLCVHDGEDFCAPGQGLIRGARLLPAREILARVESFGAQSSSTRYPESALIPVTDPAGPLRFCVARGGGVVVVEGMAVRPVARSFSHFLVDLFGARTDSARWTRLLTRCAVSAGLSRGEGGRVRRTAVGAGIEEKQSFI